MFEQSGKRGPNSSMLYPRNGEGTNEEIWSSITIKSPGSKFSFIPPAAFVITSVFAPRSFIIRTGIITCLGV